MRLVAGEPNATYVTINLGEIYIADNIKEKSFGLDGRLVVVDGTLLGFGANAEIIVDADEVGGRGFQHGCIFGQRLGVKSMTL